MQAQAQNHLTTLSAKEFNALSNFVYQVNNGGYSQWVSNGYATSAVRKTLLAFFAANDFKSLPDVLDRSWRGWNNLYGKGFEAATIWNVEHPAGKEWERLTGILKTNGQEIFHSRVLGF